MCKILKFGDQIKTKPQLKYKNDILIIRDQMKINLKIKDKKWNVLKLKYQMKSRLPKIRDKEYICCNFIFMKFKIQENDKEFCINHTFLFQ